MHDTAEKMELVEKACQAAKQLFNRLYSACSAFS